MRHRDDSGRVRMVDVGDKVPTDRRARCRAVLRMSSDTAGAIEQGTTEKGDVLTTARIAGIQAAKRTHELIPLAHPLPLSMVDLRGTVDVGSGTVTLESEARAVAPTGVEMEAMVACAVAALTVYDMVKGLERGVAITELVLLEKSGGKEHWRREG